MNSNDLPFELGVNNGDINIPLPDGVYAIHPAAEISKIRNKTEKAIVYHKDKYMAESVFKSTGNFLMPYSSQDLGNIVDAIFIQELPQSYPDYFLPEEITIDIIKDMMPYIELGLITEEELKALIPFKGIVGDSNEKEIYQDDFVIGRIILNYVPYGLDASSEELIIRNLFSGKKETGKKFLWELDGFQSVCKSSDLQNLAQQLWHAKSHGYGKNYLRAYDGKPIIRDILSKPKEDEEVWFYPYYEVFITSIRSLRRRQKILYLDKNSPSLFNFKLDILEHIFPFESSGAIIFDGIYGNEVDRIYADSYFNRDNKSSLEVKYKTVFIDTIDLSQSRPKLEIYEPQLILTLEEEALFKDAIKNISIPKPPSEWPLQGEFDFLVSESKDSIAVYVSKYPKDYISFLCVYLLCSIFIALMLGNIVSLMLLCLSLPVALKIYVISDPRSEKESYEKKLEMYMQNREEYNQEVKDYEMTIRNLQEKMRIEKNQYEQTKIENEYRKRAEGLVNQSKLLRDILNSSRKAFDDHDCFDNVKEIPKTSKVAAAIKQNGRIEEFLLH
jgi:hypothetical protein